MNEQFLLLSMNLSELGEGGREFNSNLVPGHPAFPTSPRGMIPYDEGVGAGPSGERCCLPRNKGPPPPAPMLGIGGMFPG